MAGDHGWIPDDIDISRPSVARIYDYALGGGHNLACDRVVFDKLVEIQPKLREIAWTNRAFLRRAVLFMICSGIRQFLDLGSGIPTVGNVHEIAHKVDPAARVVYVDREDIAVAHSKLLLEDEPMATMVEADIARPASILRHPDTLRLLDFAEPVGLLALTVAHYVADDEVFDVFKRYRDVTAPGSMLGITHITDDFKHVRAGDLIETTKRAGADGLHARTKVEVLQLFGDFDLVEPGLVPPSSWRPDGPHPGNMTPEDSGMWSGIAIKPWDS
jgi:hypothetical protein